MDTYQSHEGSNNEEQQHCSITNDIEKQKNNRNQKLIAKCTTKRIVICHDHNKNHTDTAEIDSRTIDSGEDIVERNNSTSTNDAKIKKEEAMAHLEHSVRQIKLDESNDKLDDSQEDETSSNAERNIPNDDTTSPTKTTTMVVHLKHDDVINQIKTLKKFDECIFNNKDEDQFLSNPQHEGSTTIAMYSDAKGMVGEVVNSNDELLSYYDTKEADAKMNGDAITGFTLNDDEFSVDDANEADDEKSKNNSGDDDDDDDDVLSDINDSSSSISSSDEENCIVSTSDVDSSSSSSSKSSDSETVNSSSSSSSNSDDSDDDDDDDDDDSDESTNIEISNSNDSENATTNSNSNNSESDITETGIILSDSEGCVIGEEDDDEDVAFFGIEDSDSDEESDDDDDGTNVTTTTTSLTDDDDDDDDEF